MKPKTTIQKTIIYNAKNKNFRNEILELSEIAEAIESTEMDYDIYAEPEGCNEMYRDLKKMYKDLDESYRKLIKDLWCKNHRDNYKYQINRNP